MKRILFLVILFVGSAMIAKAQYDAMFTQYWSAMAYYNPAFAGQDKNLNLFGLFRQQWVGIPHASTTFFVAADMQLPIKKINQGIGVIAYTEKIGLFSNTHVAAQYAYKKKLWGGVLSIGLQAGFVNRVFDGSKVYIPESDDHEATDAAIPTTSVDDMSLDVNAGLYYIHKKFYVGVGVTHLTEPVFDLNETASIYIPRGYNLTGGYNIKLRNPLYQIQPSVFIKTDMISLQADLTGRVVYNKKFDGGLSWRINESFIVLLGATFGNIRVGYAYDLPTTPILKGSSGSHELCIQYRVPLHKTKKGKNKHKSVRIL